MALDQLAAAAAGAEELAEGMQAGMMHSRVIGQAVGILMAQQNVNAAAAFNLLRTASQNRNIKIRDLATDMTSRYDTSPHPGST